MQQIVNYSLHKINNEVDFGFNPQDYSSFKFGDDKIAREFGTSLAKGFIQDFLQYQQIKEQIVVISSPYSFIPTATFALKNHFVFKLNRWLADNGHAVVQETKVHRTVTYKEDYGELSAKQRLELISNDSFHIDKDFLNNKILIFLDDIKITGSHERMILNMANNYNLNNQIYMLYFAELVNDTIHPNIENYLNYFSVKSIFDLDDIISNPNFCINTRIVKYILNTATESFMVFLNNQSHAFINHLYDMAIGNGYHTIDSYAQNLNNIKKHLNLNNYKLV
ncbi:MAG: hypothetical protein EAZ15_09670 [Sphingobacteriales bacterium]|nr:MAG: hypothetical protein EAZ15_09670 [Sphingobacteriales bacterium]